MDQNEKEMDYRVPSEIFCSTFLSKTSKRAFVVNGIEERFA